MQKSKGRWKYGAQRRFLIGQITPQGGRIFQATSSIVQFDALELGKTQH